MKQIEVLVTYKYTLNIDENNFIVKDYKDEKEMIDHLVDYRFTTLPVLESGVVVMDIEAVEWEKE